MRKKEEYKSKINVTLNKSTIEKTDIEAREQAMTRSAFINAVLEDWFVTKDYIKNSMPEILKGIDDIKSSLEKFGISSDSSDPAEVSERESEPPETLPEKSKPVKKSTQK